MNEQKYRKNQELIEAFLTYPNPFVDKELTNCAALAAKQNADYQDALREGFIRMFEKLTTKKVSELLKDALAEHCAPAIQAGLEELARRNESKLLFESLGDFGSGIEDGGNQEKIAKSLSRHRTPTLLWAYGKTLNLRRHEHAARPDCVAEYISFKDFLLNKLQPGDIDIEFVDENLSLSVILGGVSDLDVVIKQDHDSLRYLLEALNDPNFRIIPKKPRSVCFFSIRQLRRAASSTQIDDECRSFLNAILTGNMGGRDAGGKSAVALSETDRNMRRTSVLKNIEDYLLTMSAKELSEMHLSTFNALSNTLEALGVLRIDETFNGDAYIKLLLGSTIFEMDKPDRTSLRKAINPEIARRLGVDQEMFRQKHTTPRGENSDN